MSKVESVTCPRCGNADQDKFVAETKNAGKDFYGRRQVRLIGWRCQACKHVIPEE